MPTRLHLAAFILSASLTTAARADILYTYSGAAGNSGTYFVVDSPGFLSYSLTNPVVPVSGELFSLGNDFGAITSVYFVNYNLGAVTRFGGNTIFNGNFNIAVDGTYFDPNGDRLVISGTPTMAPPPTITPEPSSILLLGTGILSLAATARRRLAESGNMTKLSNQKVP